MGHEIVYCFKCLTRLTGAEFEKGKAFRSGLKVSCQACLPELLSTLSPEERRQFQEPSRPREPQGISSTRIGAIRPTTTRRRLEEEPSGGGKGKGLGLGLGGGAVLLLVVGLVLLRPKPAEPPPTTPPVAEAPQRPVTEDPRLRRAREAVGRAKGSPGDLDARLALWAEAVKAAQGTELHAEALEAEQALLKQRGASYRKELEALVEEARPVLGRGEHAKAAEVYERAKSRHPDGDWGRLLSDQAAGVRREAETVYESLKVRALEAARQGRAADAKAAEEQVARLGYPGLSAELRKELDATKPGEKPKESVPPPPSAELLAYRDEWRRAVALAVARDFDGAVAGQARAAANLKEAEAKAEAKRDAEDFTRLKELFSEIRRATPQLAPGRDVSLEVFDDDGGRKRVEGKLLRAWPGREELSGDPTVFVETSDLTAASLLEGLAQLRKPAAMDQRALCLLSAAEGDAAAAERLFPGIPRKYRDLAKDAASRIPKRPEREREARKLFHAAEREYRELASRGEAVAKYRKLAAEFLDASIVRGDADLVRRRAEEGREHLLVSSSIKAGGTFRAQKGEKPESFWGSVEDTDPEKTAENFVEFEFLAAADTAYKAWVYAGGCCGEVFSFGWQATDLSGPNPRKSSETIQAPPEGPNHLPVRHGVLYLKPKHSDHLGPKSPKRWAWVPLPLPKYTAPGVKRVRLLTCQKGFSVAYALVSPTRTAPPGDAELKDLLARAKGASPDTGMLAWWRLDEPSGEVAADSGGRGWAAEAKGAVEWGAKGRLGGAVRLPGNNAWLEVPHQAALNAFPLTVSAWIQTSAAGASLGVVNKYVSASHNGYQVQVYQGAVRAWYFREKGSSVWDGAEGLNGGPVNDGAWHHVAFVVDADGGRLFVDGVRKDARAWSGTPGATTTAQVLSLGRYPGTTAGGSFFEGLIDDVRIYGRPLGDAELQALHASGPPEPEESRPWKPVFDGKTTAFLGGGSENDWKVENGVLVRVAGNDNAAQSREQFGDLEFRIRFERVGGGSARFSFRQGGDGTYTVHVNDAKPQGKPRELVVTCRGDEVKAILDGQMAAVEASGKPARGHLQFNYSGGALRILSVETRPLP